MGAAALGLVVASACGSAEEPASAEDELDEAELGEAEMAMGVFCGGIAGFACPDGTKCVDDRTDDCDPRRGGADCGGVCVRENRRDRCADPAREYLFRNPRKCEGVQIKCAEGSEQFSDQCGCGCQPEPPPPPPPPGEACGTAVCDSGMVCCNSSCGICTPPGGVCIQIACGVGEAL